MDMCTPLVGLLFSDLGVAAAAVVQEGEGEVEDGGEGVVLAALRGEGDLGGWRPGGPCCQCCWPSGGLLEPESVHHFAAIARACSDRD